MNKIKIILWLGESTYISHFILVTPCLLKRNGIENVTRMDKNEKNK